MMTKLLTSVLLACALLLLSARAGFSQASASSESDLAAATVVVDGMMKSKSGATWLGWPEGVEAALEGLAGIEKIEVDLEHDAFTVLYRPRELAPDEILEAIKKLGFTPSLEDIGGTIIDSEGEGPPCEPWPEPITEALASARRAGKALFLDFFAEWCAPCQTLEKEILPHPAVKDALESFEFLRVDTDQSPQAAQCLDVYGLPTVVVLDPRGTEVFRHQGLLPAEELAQKLRRLNR